jgi:hypothetical protein
MADEDYQPFDISEVPRGAVVTLPHPAYTLAPLALHLRAHPSDKKQVLKLSTLSLEGQSRAFRVAIFDRQSQHVRYLTLKPGAPVLYHFKGLNEIRIVPDIKPTESQWMKQRLLLESNRPLGVSHENGRLESPDD